MERRPIRTPVHINNPRGEERKIEAGLEVTDRRRRWSSSVRREDETSSGGGFSIAIRLRRIADGKCFWFKATPPKDLQINNDSSCCFIHSHEDDIINFYKQQDFNAADLIDCKYPLCRFACIGSTLYFAGGDEDIDCHVLAINSQLVPRPSNYAPVLSRHSKNNTSHRIGSVDFFNPLTTEQTLDTAPQLLTPRYRPKIVAVGGKLFLFGGNAAPLSPDNYAPFAEVFNPATGLCSPIQDPPFPNRIGDSRLFVTPFLGINGEQHILLMSHACYFSFKRPTGYDSISLYDVATDSWESYSDPGRVLFHNSLHIVGPPVPVPEQDSIYWLKGSKNSGYICSYNWKTKTFWEGPFIGLHHELPFHNFGECPMILLHIRKDLFCVVWHNLVNMQSWSSIESDNISTHIHFTLLRLSREDPPSRRLFSFVVGCFSHVLPESAACTLLDGFCLKRL